MQDAAACSLPPACSAPRLGNRLHPQHTRNTHTHTRSSAACMCCLLTSATPHARCMRCITCTQQAEGDTWHARRRCLQLAFSMQRAASCQSSAPSSRLPNTPATNIHTRFTTKPLTAGTSSATTGKRPQSNRSASKLRAKGTPTLRACMCCALESDRLHKAAPSDHKRPPHNQPSQHDYARFGSAPIGSQTNALHTLRNA